MSEHSEQVLDWLAHVNGIDVQQLSRHVYRYENAQAVSHLMCSQWARFSHVG